MWPFIKNVTGLWRKPRYRLMPSGAFNTRFFLWDRQERNVKCYFNNLEEAYYYIEMNNIDCDQHRIFN